MQLTCRTCRKKLVFEQASDLPYFPFCSERCRLIDLGRWADETYRISTNLDRDREESRPETPDADGPIPSDRTDPGADPN